MQPTPSTHVRGRHYKYYDLVMVGFVAVILCSNLIGPGKTCLFDVHVPLIPHFNIGSPDKPRFEWSTLLIFGAGNIFFPISYIFDDVITEVYGYARSRKVIWAAFGAMVFATVMSWVVIHLPQDPKEPFNAVMQPALETCFGNTWRITAGSLLAFWLGDFVNSYVMAKMKIWTKGKMLWTRTIGSTIVGEGVDCLVFYPVAFAGIWKADTMVSVVIFNWIFKVMVEVVMTPFTYAVCGWLKRAEREDFYDYDTKFTPFSLKD